MNVGLNICLDDLDHWTASSEREREAMLAAAGVSDGLPLGTVSAHEVLKALATIGLGPDDVVATLPPLMRQATAGSIAIWALIAGCRPRSLPVVLAAVEAMSDPAFNGPGIMTTTGTAAVATIVSGPLAKDFNSSGNLLGPGTGANGSVGRAVAFVTRAMGAVPGITDMATMGQPGKYTFCFAENHAASPWEPFHVARGFSPETSTVTVFAASGTVEVTNAYVEAPGDVLATLAASMFQPGSFDPVTGLLGGGHWLLLLSPEWAELLARNGLSRADICSELARRAQWHLSMLPDELSRLCSSTPRDATSLRSVASPDDIVLVVGGGVGIKQTLMSSWSGGSRSVTVSIRTTV